MITKVRDTFLKSTMNGQFMSFAYDDEVEIVNNSNNNFCPSLDFLSSFVNSIKLNDYQNLTQLRISKCNNLEAVKISNMPNLYVVDLLDNKRLQSVEFEKCPKLVTLDVGFCSNLRNLKGIQTLNYLSAPYCSSLNDFHLPKDLVFFDSRRIPSIDASHVIQNLSNLECFIYNGEKSLK